MAADHKFAAHYPVPLKFVIKYACYERGMIYKNLSDQALLNETQKLVGEERRITLSVLHALREIEARALHARESFPSLYEFCTKRLGYSESQAVRRISAMRLLKAVPEMEAKVASGELKVSQLAQVQTFIRAERKEMGRIVSREETRKLLSEVAGRSSRETERVILAQSPALRERRQTEERVRVVTETHTEVRFVADHELMALVEEAKALFANNREMNPSVADLMKRGLQVLIAQKKKERGVGVSTDHRQKELPATAHVPVTNAIPSVPAPKARYIPSILKRAVFARAENRCEFVAVSKGEGDDRRRCQATHALELHHVRAFAHGGEHSIANLRAYCRGHNAAQASWDFPARRDD